MNRSRRQDGGRGYAENEESMYFFIKKVHEFAQMVFQQVGKRDSEGRFEVRVFPDCKKKTKSARKWSLNRLMGF